MRDFSKEMRICDEIYAIFDDYIKKRRENNATTPETYATLCCMIDGLWIRMNDDFGQNAERLSHEDPLFHTIGKYCNDATDIKSMIRDYTPEKENLSVSIAFTRNLFKRLMRDVRQMQNTIDLLSNKEV